MSLIRLQNKVPSIYPEKSRDFQLFCRLYDIILNGLKFDIDGVSRLSNSRTCSSTVLQLLQTKIGFFTDKDFTDTILRYIVQCFPLLVKKKGTELAIQQAVYMFLKITGFETTVKVKIIEDQPTSDDLQLYGARITDHCVTIGIEGDVQDVTVLREVLKYIIPFGYNVFFYFFVSQSTKQIYEHKDRARLIFTSNDVNSMGGSKPIAEDASGNPKDWNSDEDVLWYAKPVEQEFISGINMVETESKSDDARTDNKHLLNLYIEPANFSASDDDEE